MSHSSHVPTHQAPHPTAQTSAVRKKRKKRRKGTEETGVRTFNTRPLRTIPFLLTVEACLSRLYPRISIEIGPNASLRFAAFSKDAARDTWRSEMAACHSARIYTIFGMYFVYFSSNLVFTHEERARSSRRIPVS